MKANLNNQVAIVTGSSKGIGKAIAIQLAKLGAKITVNYSGSKEAALDVVKEIESMGGQAIAVRADVSSLSDLDHLFSETIDKFGKVDILINNAGIMNNKLITEVTEDDFDRQFNINVKGTYFACQKAMLYMEEHGRIINFSTSVAGSMLPAYSVYAATKGAVEQLTRQLAKEFSNKKININAIAPGPVKTELFLKDKTEQQIEAMGKLNAFGRLGEPEDIADVIEFLVSNKSHWITGQIIRVNGGFN